MNTIYYRNYKQEKYIFFSALLCLLAVILIEYNKNWYGYTIETFRFTIILGLLMFCIHTILYSILNHKLLTLYYIFLLSFYIFQNGQMILYALNIDYNYFYIERYELSYLVLCSLYSTYSLLIALFIAGLSMGTTRDKMHRMDRYNYAISKMAPIIFFINSIISIPLLLYKLRFAIIGDYYLVREIEGRIPFILGFIEYFFIPLGILALIYSVNNFQIRVLSMVIISWSILTALVGDRTTGIAGILIVILILINTKIITKRALKSNWAKRGMPIILLLILLGYFIQIAYLYRVKEPITFKSIFSMNVIFLTLGELGFSFFPLLLSMRIVPQIEAYELGRTYLYSIPGGIFPESLDFTGIIRYTNEISRIPQKWLEEHYSYNFGLGFSLNAESFVNFGWFGLIAIFLICVIVARVLKEPNFKNKSYKFSQYISFVMLFIAITLPRREIYYLIKGYVYNVILVSVLFILIGKLLKKTGSSS